MALAKKCDRCGKFYEHYPIGEPPRTGTGNAVSRIRRGRDLGTKIALDIMDLCPDCMESFDRFMEGADIVKKSE